MVDPTWIKPCPACGYGIDVNQMGQVYAHSAITGCPYSGSGALAPHGVYPLKFGYKPCIRIAQSDSRATMAATIRPTDEHETFAYGDQTHVSIRTGDGEVFGIGEVVQRHRGKVPAVVANINQSGANINYGHSTAESVVDALNGYYSYEITPDTHVTAFVFEPTVTL